jgi:replication factor C subunit 3/5
MLLINKYTPNTSDEMYFHKQLLDALKIISEDDSIPHIMFFGPEGSGKKTLIKLFLEMIYDESVNELKECIYKVVGSGNKITDVPVLQSDHHIIVEPGGNNFDKYLIHEIVKEYASRAKLNVFKAHKTFKTILINRADNLSRHAQASLRRTMELYSNTCRFIVWGRSISKIIEPLRSRCICFRVPSPSYVDMCGFIHKICTNENISMDINKLAKLTSNANGNIKTALWLINLDKINESKYSMYMRTISKITHMLIDNNLNNVNEIRSHLYSIIITNINSCHIIKDIMLYLCNNDSLMNLTKVKIISVTAKYEHNLIRGRRDAVHLIGFVTHVMKLIKEEQKITDTSNKQLIEYYDQ